MTLDFLPPQAYTKETLLKAYNWLQSQPDHVKELATTPDQLVSLYLKSSRLGQDSIQRYSSNHPTPPPGPNGFSSLDPNQTPSIQSFKSELKNLAGMMGDLEKPQNQAGYPTPPPLPPQAPTYTPPSTSQPSHSYQTVNTSISSQSIQPAAPAPMPAPAASAKAPLHDEMTQALIREVKNELNLSSDQEALRMLVKIGYQKVRSLYK
jgi:hypothetical protein